MKKLSARLNNYRKQSHTFTILLNNGYASVANENNKKYVIGDKIKCMIHGNGTVVEIKTKQSALGPIKTLIVQKHT